MPLLAQETRLFELGICRLIGAYGECCMSETAGNLEEKLRDFCSFGYNNLHEYTQSYTATISSDAYTDYIVMLVYTHIYIHTRPTNIYQFCAGALEFIIRVL